ncbi:MAG: electron transport complex subunit E [Clostridia bacterium]|nr:electron transport complex subunit E [Clostridia bacterium]
MFKDGLLDQNPIFVQLLGMCSTLAISTNVINGIGMGLSVTFVLILSNLFISLLRKFIPSKIRIASYIVIIAGFVTVVDMVMQAYLPSLAESLGLFIPLIVVNCLILARAESFASKNKPLPSVLDGLAMGLGFTLALVIISAIRELIGSGTLLGYHVLPESFSPAVLVISPVGGFLILGGLIALVQWIKSRFGKKED